MTTVYLLIYFDKNIFDNFFKYFPNTNFFSHPDLDTKYPSQAHCPDQRHSRPPSFLCHQVSTSLVKRFNRTVREEDAVIDADAIRCGEGGGETQEGKNPMRNGTLWRSREKERRRWLKLPRSEPLVLRVKSHRLAL